MNPNERGKSNGRFRQTLEIGGGISNTVTSVLKDFYVFVVYEKNNRT